MFEIHRLVEPVSAAEPCGPDLGYDGAFLELERLAAGVPEQRMGWSIRAAVAPDWAAVAHRAIALLARTKDWRVALLLARAALHVQGWPGLERGLGLMLALERTFGAAVHPRPDDDDPEGWWIDEEPSESTAAGRFGPEHPLLADLYARRIGVPPDELTLRDVEWIQESNEPPTSDGADLAGVRRAVTAELQRVPDLGPQVMACLAVLGELAAAVQDRLSNMRWHSALLRIHRCLTRLAGAVQRSAAEAGGGAGEAAAGPGFAIADAQPLPTAASEWAVTTRQRSPPRPATPALDLEALLTPVGGDAPCGPDLEYDIDFFELQRLEAGVADRMLGGREIPGLPPDWPEVHRRAVQLLGRTKDLRLAVILARAATCSNGFRGAAEGLRLVARLLAQWWDGVHPVLDAMDDNDPTMRVNVLAALASREGLLGDLRALEIGGATDVVLAGEIERALIETSAMAGPGPEDRLVLQRVVAAQLVHEPGFARSLDDARAALRDIDAAIASCIGHADALQPLARFLERLESAATAAARGEWPARQPHGAPASQETAAPATGSQRVRPEPLPPPDPLPSLDAADLERARAVLDRIRARLQAAPGPAATS